MSSSLDSFYQGVQGSHNGAVHMYHQDRVDELNTRMESRYYADRPLQPNFSPRPIPTKYAHFPMINRRAKPEVPIDTTIPNYDMRTNFAPMTDAAPVQFYLANIDTESILQNRHNSLQYGAEQGVYVPHSNSDMYGFSAVGRQEEQNHPSLFRRETHVTTGSNVADLVGRDFFRNCTRTQLRNL